MHLVKTSNRANLSIDILLLYLKKNYEPHMDYYFKSNFQHQIYYKVINAETNLSWFMKKMFLKLYEIINELLYAYKA